MGPFVPADPGLIERVLASSGAERTPAPPDASYPGELAAAASRYLTEALVAGASKLHLTAAALTWIAAGLAAVLALLIARLVVSRLRRRRPVPESGEAAAPGRPPAAPRDAAAWRAELERRLAEGRTAEALEALWWWLARSLAGGEAEPDWTGRDLVAHSPRKGREELREIVRRLDAYAYGPRPPRIEDLRGLLGRIEEALA